MNASLSSSKGENIKYFKAYWDTNVYCMCGSPRYRIAGNFARGKISSFSSVVPSGEIKLVNLFLLMKVAYSTSFLPSESA